MKYTIGYQLPDGYDSTYSLCCDYREHISGVYFSFANQKGGRMPLCSDDEQSVKEVGDYQLEELKEIRKLGIPTTLLFNANCYGQEANSKDFAKQMICLAEHLKKEGDISSITTTSPFLAKNLKGFFGKEIEITASVNMAVGTPQGVDQLGEFFDGFYIKKELIRQTDKINELRSYCDKNGKKLRVLANGGCISFCAFSTYHDNLVAHHNYMQISENDEEFPSPCWEYLHGLPENEALAKILASNWIRPEDVKNYEGLFDEMKLATRMHSSPRRVVSAYARGKFSGNILDLFEPSYSSLFNGIVLDNTRFPEDWFEKTSKCGKNCHTCNYCAQVVQKIRKNFYL